MKVEKPKKFPAIVGIHEIEDGETVLIVDPIFVSSESGFETLVKSAEKRADGMIKSKVGKAAKALYGDVSEEEVMVLKAGWQLGVQRYGKERGVAGVVGYEAWPGYAGLSKRESELINAWLWDQAFLQKTLSLEKLTEGLVRKFKIPRPQAENIVRTELANIFNKMREWAYLSEARVGKFKWVTKHDACEKCKEVEARTAKGVTMDELKAIIKEVGGEYAREWTVHPQCRCTFVRT
ncbi:MAG: hypothetical protein QXP43_05610 [Nitrososphaerota archaeon]